MPSRVKASSIVALILLALQLLMQTQSFAQSSTAIKVRRNHSNQAFIVYDPASKIAGTRAARTVQSGSAGRIGRRPLSSTERSQVRDKGLAFLRRHAAEFKIRSVSDLKLVETTNDTPERNSAIFQQKHNGIPVLGAYLRTVSNSAKSNDVFYSTGHYLDLSNITLDTTPRVTEKEAQDLAIGYLLSKYQLPGIAQSFNNPAQLATLYSLFPAKLFIVNSSLLRGRLVNNRAAYSLEYFVDVNVGPDVSGVVRVNAITKEILGYIDGRLSGDSTSTGTGSTGTGTLATPIPVTNIISDCTTGCICPVRRNGPQSPVVGTNPVYGGTDVDSSYDYFGLVAQYFESEFGATDMRAIGATSSLDANTNRSFTYYNGCNGGACAGGGAWFTMSPRLLMFCAGSLTLDIFGHEFFHAFIAKRWIDMGGASIAVIGQGEAGAMGEAMADLFGLDIKSWVNFGNFTWLFGEGSTLQAKRHLFFPGALNYRINSTTHNVPYPDTYSADNFPCGNEDNGFVHARSTVIGYAMARAAGGSTGFEDPTHMTYKCGTVVGIGLYKITQVLYFTIVNSAAGIYSFNEFYDAVDMACDQFVSDPSNRYGVTEFDCQQIRISMQVAGLDQPTFGQCKPFKYVPTCATNLNAGDVVLDEVNNDLDRVAWTADYNKTSPANMSLRLAADLNGDRIVNGADFTLAIDEMSSAQPPFFVNPNSTPTVSPSVSPMSTNHGQGAGAGGGGTVAPTPSRTVTPVPPLATSTPTRTPTSIPTVASATPSRTPSPVRTGAPSGTASPGYTPK